jgi:large subunit ribosomal protein L10
VVTKERKVQTIEDLKVALLNSKLTVVSDYQGTTVSEITELRREIQKAGGDFTVAKNTLIKLAIKDQSYAGNLGEFLSGPTGVAYTSGDPVPVAKALTDYIKKVKKTTIKGGVLEGKKISEDDIKSIAALPSREVLISKLLGSMNAPAQNVVYALSGVSRNLVYVLDAVRQQKEAQGQ